MICNKMNMNKLLIFTSVMCLALAVSCSDSVTLKVMSYNVRLDTSSDGDNAWEYRKEATLAMLEELRPDVFGVQEALPNQVEYISANAPMYDNVGVGREDGKSDGEHMSVFWNTETIEMIGWGTYWLSETPEEPSFGWDAACRRTATWTLMKDRRNGRKFFFVNTHLDHRGVQARKEGLKLLVDRISAMNPDSYPMVLTGDFNMESDHPSLADLNEIMTSTRTIAAKTDSHITYNGWGACTGSDGVENVIDYIYVSGFSSVPEYATIVKRYADKPYISDHYPILSVLEY